ncbi:glycosyl hydrolase [Vararia minispora EC-137]|uniref:Glycosyl hydrolase n=1 Tax=Vararia minispora EC-137 TaxID=1314806 RepID=A0ACB8QBJ3_9AGAM|nr:glycosyl hydrolase [Vararia minispora EC-137]
MASATTILLVAISLPSVLAGLYGDPPILTAAKHTNSVNNTACSLDQTQPPGNLTLCGNNTLFSVWRPVSRFIAPEGWQNDPQDFFQIVHLGYQCNPQHIQWGNISQCAALSKDLTFWTDVNSWHDPKTLYPSQLSDIRGVFDGTVVVNGWNGYPTTLYTSTYPGGQLGASSSPAEIEGTETVSLAYTTNGGSSWIKLPFGSQGNPIICTSLPSWTNIYKWPKQNLTGFRDPYIFQSPILSKVLDKSSAGATGPNFLTISGGVRLDADPQGGPMIFLYRQTDAFDLRGWTYLGPLVSEPALSSFSKWSGNFGINFETVAVTRLNEEGEAFDDGSDESALDVAFMGTEGGRNGSHENHWPLWAALTHSNNASSGSFSTIDFAGVGDWGRSYAFTCFPVKTNGRNRSVLVGWSYEDDEDLVLAMQRGYQGSFTLFRDLYVKIIRNVDPSFAGINETGSWKSRIESDGSTSIVTVGQKVIKETLTSYKHSSIVSKPVGRTVTVNASAVTTVNFGKQPLSRSYAVSGTLRFNGDARAGFRVRASVQEWTDVWFDSEAETMNVNRTNSSLISTYGTELETGKLRLWPILNANGTGSVRQELNLTIFVDNSVIEVYANDVTVITTRVYPWLSSSKNVSFFVAPTTSGGSGTVEFSALELWDGLIRAWPERPDDTSKPLQWDGPIASIYGLWQGW